jgi:uncharacterized lipoprotein YmbA
MKLLRPVCLMGMTFSIICCVGGPAPQVYVMTAAGDSKQAQTTDASIPALQVETASLPAFLDNSDILVRRGPYALDASSTGHWGERLSLGITHALSADLTQKLPGYRVSLGRSESPAGLRLQLEVDSFDVYPDGHCVMAANWTIVQKSGIKPPAFGRGVFATPASAENHAADAELVSAMARAVGQLADAIVASM